MKALLFDLGGVLIQRGSPEPLVHWAERLAIAPDELIRRGFDHPLAHSAIVGATSAEAYWRAVAEVLGLPAADAAALSADFAVLASWDKALLAYLTSLKPRFKLGVITGAMSDARAMIESQVGRSFFDVIVVTAEERLAKPDVALYQRAVERLGVLPSEALFFDDWIDSVEGARSAGLQAIHVQQNMDVIGAIRRAI
jgi:glucose-1-phosphatase